MYTRATRRARKGATRATYGKKRRKTRNKQKGGNIGSIMFNLSQLMKW